jgi:iron complex outermembrane receptor protein
VIVIRDLKSAFAIVLILVFFAFPAAAQDTASTTEPDSTTSGELGHKKEKVVVTASRKEQVLEEVPAAVTVNDAEEIETSPADNFFADGLRSVPGINIAQTSAATVSISTRTATNVIPQGQLAMMDHRSFYQDFNGFVFWGTVPVELEDIKQIETVRGPGSAVWGANAMHGIVHIVTKAPKEMVGTRLKVTGGELNTASANLTHAGVRGRLGYRVSGGYNFQGPFTQPTGAIPGSEGPTNPGGTLYPEYDNLDTKRYRVNARIDYDTDPETTWSVSGGYAAVEGMFLSPGGPSTMDQGTLHAFGKVDWTRRRSMRVTAFMNHDVYDGRFLNGNIPQTANDQTYNLDFTDTRLAGERHILTYGGNFRLNTYDNGLAPGAPTRDSYGVFLQDDLYISEMLRLVVGARWDYIDPMGNAISPRASLLITPWSDQQFRVSYNRAFQSPSVLQNYIQFPNVLLITFPDFNDPGSGPVTIPILAMTRGSTELDAKQLDAFEIGWSGRVGRRTSVNVAGYWNEFRNSFQYVVSDFYTGSNPPPGWPFDPALLDGLLANSIPSEFMSANLGKSTERGVEVGTEILVSRAWTAFGNYSWQDIPELEDFEPVRMPDGTERPPVNIPPRHRFNVGLAWDVPRFYANGTVAFQDDAFWTDIIDSRAWGPSDAFTMVNAAVGVRFAQESLVLSVNALNLFDAKVQQHAWGDFIDRRIVGQVSYRF